MNCYNETQLEYIRRSGTILSATLLEVKKALAPGVSTLELDKVADNYIVSQGGTPCFKNYRDYGFATCISVNEEIIHGMPRADKIVKSGDIVSIDVGVRWNGFCTDAARTFGVGKICKEAQDLINATEASFWEAVKNLKAGSTIGEIGKAVEGYIKTNTNYSILEFYFGHGIGKNVHEDPLIPNYVPSHPSLKKETRKKLVSGAVICIEPMINQGAKETKTLADGWTVVTADGKLAAHYENTVIVHKDSVEVVTD